MATMAADIDSDNIDDRTAWRAVEMRDTHYDGRFVYAVSSTHIYCKPSCASRRPSRANVAFFESPDAAEKAGYRACKRCNPREPHADSATTKGVERARKYLDANVEPAVPLARLARRARRT